MAACSFVRGWLMYAATGLAASACGSGADPPVASIAAPVLAGSFDSGDRAVVALTSNEGKVFCTGTLISSRIVLTAGHCAYSSTPYYAYFGQSTPFTPGDLVRVQKRIAHPDFDPDDFRHADIGLILLKSRAPAEPRTWNTTPIDESFVGRDVRIVGFGFQQPAGELNRRIGDKMAVQLPILQLVDPKEYEYMLGTCNGDSGGPHFYTFSDGAERVIGVTSYGRDGCTGTSGAHRVDLYDAWIREQIAALDPPSCEKDYRCQSGCAEADPDCPCAPDDGFCSASCTDPGSDPDCPPGCGGGDVCVHECPAPDPDCGDPCVAEGHCVDGCPVRDPDCPAPLSLGATCGSSFECVADSLCLTPLPESSAECTPTCDPDGAACADGLECRRVLGDTSACLPPFEWVRGYDQGGCAVGGGGGRGGGGSAWLAALAAALVLAAQRRRRRRG